MYSFTQNHDFSQGDAAQVNQDIEKLITAYGGYLTELGNSMLSAFGEAYQDGKNAEKFAQWLKNQNQKEEEEYKGLKVYKNQKLVLGKKTNNLTKDNLELIESAKLARVGMKVGDDKQNFRFTIMDNTVLEVKKGIVEANYLREHLSSNKYELVSQNQENNPIIELLSKQGLSINEPVIISLNEQGEIEVKKAETSQEKAQETPQLSKNQVVNDVPKWEVQADKILEKVKQKNTLDIEQTHTFNMLSQSLKGIEKEINNSGKNDNNIEVKNYSLHQYIQEKEQQQSSPNHFQDLSEEQSSNLILHKHDKLIAEQLKVISGLHSGNSSSGLNLEGEKYNLTKMGSDYTLKNQENQVLIKFCSDPSLGIIVLESNLNKEQRLSISNDLKENIESFGLRGSFASKDEQHQENLKFISDLSKTLHDYTNKTKKSEIINGNHYRIEMKESGEIRIDDKINNRGTLYIETQGIVILNKVKNDDLKVLKQFKQWIENDLNRLSVKNLSEAKVIETNNGSIISTESKDIKTNNPNFNKQFNIPNPQTNLTVNDDKNKDKKKKDKGVEL